MTVTQGEANRRLSLFLVERNLHGLTTQEMLVLQGALRDAVGRLASAGDEVRYLRSTFVASQSRCFCVFEAASRDLVRRVNETAQVPFVRIDEAIEFPNLVAAGI